jgi:hypothetical protein
MSNRSSTPIVCDMTAAPDTPRERLAEWGRLFEHALADGERTTDGVIWRFVARPGVEEWVRDLAEREAACCRFLDFAVTADDAQVTYRITGDDDPMVQAALDEIHAVPTHIAEGIPGLLDRLRGSGLDIRTGDDRAAATASPRQ